MRKPTETSARQPGTRPALARRRGPVALTFVLLLGAVALVSCSQDPPRRDNSELRADPAVAATAEPNEATLPDAVPNNSTEPPAEPLTGAGRRYRVLVGTAYFFDKPEQSTPSGRYLRRGDTFYGEGETNGFVKTGFVQPNGVSGTAWLKVQELSKLAGGGTRTLRPPVAVRIPAATTPRQPAAAAPPAQGRLETGETAAAIDSPSRAVVQTDRAYFYDSPDLASPRKAYCERGDKVRVGEEQGAAVYVTFTNWEKVTTTGWMKKAAIRFTP